MTTAKKDSWEIQPKPESSSQLNYEISLSESEMLSISHGIIPDGMEDRWFVYSEGEWIYFHRSWTGYLIYWVRIVEATSNHYRIAEVWASRDPDQYKETNDAYDIQLFDYLFRSLLLKQKVAFPQETTTEPDNKPWWRFWGN